MNIFNYKGQEFSNLLLLIGTMFTLSRSNSYKRDISVFDDNSFRQVLNTWHIVLEMQLIRQIIDSIWVGTENEEIVQCTLNIYIGEKKM